MKILRAIGLALIGLWLSCLPILAYSYYSTFAAVETGGTSYTMLGVTATIANDDLIAAHYMASTALDTAVTLSGGSPATKPHMVVEDRTIFASAITGGGTANFHYEMGNSPLLASFYVIPGYGGLVTTNDAPALEPGNNFEVEIDGYIDTSAGASKNILNKASALQLYVSGANTLTGIMQSTTNTLDQQQTTQDTDLGVYSVGWQAQTFIPANTAYIGRVSLYMKKTGNPTNNITASIRAVDGANKPTGADLCSGTYAAGSLGAGYGWVDFNFASPALLTSGTTYAIVVRDPPDNTPNNPLWGANTAGGYASGQWWTSADSGATWSAAYACDACFKTYYYPQVTVSSGGVASGEHTVKLTADAANLILDVDGADVDTEALGGVSCGDNASNFIWMQNNSVVYADYIKYSVGGTLLINYDPVTVISGTTLPDREGAAQNGIFTYGANPAGLTVTVGSLISGSSTATSTSTVTAPPDVVHGGNQEMTGASGASASPFHPLFDAIETASGGKVSEDLQGYLFAALFAAGGLVAGGMATKGAFMFPVVLGGGLGLGAGYALKFYQDVWILYVCALLFIMALFLDARKSW